MRVLRRLEGWFRRGGLEREREGAEARDAFDEELVRHDLSGAKEDVFVAEGDGLVAPCLPEATPREVYEEFEHDLSRPVDPAP